MVHWGADVVRDRGAVAVLDDRKIFTVEAAAKVALILTIALQVTTEGVHVVLEAQPAHGPDYVFGTDGHAMLPLATLVGLASDKGYVFRGALLDRIFGVVGSLGVHRQDAAHDTNDVGDRQVMILLPEDDLGLCSRGRGG